MPRPRLPGRRHGRAHHAQRRGPAARGRPLAPVVGRDPQLHLLRPDLQLRAGGDRAGRAAPHVPGTGGRLLLPDGDERELRASGDAGGAEADILKGMYLFRRGAKSERAAGTVARFGDDLPRSHRRRRAAEVGLGRRGRPVELPELQRTGARRQRRRCAGTCCTRPSSPGCPTSNTASRAAADRWWRPPTMCACSPTRSVPSCRALRHARHRRLRPLGYAPEAAPLLRGGSPLGHGRRPHGAGGRWRPSSAARWPLAIAKYGIDVDKPNPRTCVIPQSDRAADAAQPTHNPDRLRAPRWNRPT